MRPLKKFSQNFLTDPKTAQRIVEALDVQAGDVVVEIGPGTGMLTQYLLGKPLAKLICFELDERAIEVLGNQEWGVDPRLEMRCKDILECDIAAIAKQNKVGNIKVIGNIPYSITSPILFWMFKYRKSLSASVIMMQSEVAERCIAKPRQKDYGILTYATWLSAGAKITARVKPGSFFPKPKVSSAVVKFDFKKPAIEESEFSDQMTFIRSAFSQRRKVLSNSLRTWLGSRTSSSVESILRELTIDIGKSRAEELAPEGLQTLYIELVKRLRAISI